MMHRRHILRSLMGASLLLPGLLSELLATEKPTPSGEHPLAPKAPHFEGKAKRVILLFSQGGVSHVDTFDHKPGLERDHGKSSRGGSLLKSPFAFKPSGSSGLPISELFRTISTSLE